MRLKIFLLLIAICLLSIVSKAQGYILAGSDGYGPEPTDRHFFNTNLTANGNRTHNANQKLVNITELAGWKMYSGILSTSAFVFDSAITSIESVDDIQISADDDLTLYGGGPGNSKIWVHDDQILLNNTLGQVKITGLDRDDNENDVIGISEATGKLVMLACGSGVFNPTASAESNFTLDGGIKGSYSRIGDVVTMSIYFSGAASASETLTSFRVDLPITDASFSSRHEAIGSGSMVDGDEDSNPVGIFAKESSNSVQVQWYSWDTDTHIYSATFMYQILH